MMNPEITELPAFTINGFKIRTNNKKEFDAETAQIPKLWSNFYSQIAMTLQPDAHIYGIYTGYESNHEGDFDVIACTDQKITDDLTGFVTRHIPTERYLKFSKSGKMPEAVIHLWQEVWHYFAHKECPYHRTYTQDIEYYLSNDSVEIFIAIH